MQEAHQQAKKALKELQQLVRQKKGKDAVVAEQRQITGDTPEDEPQIVSLTSEQVAAIRKAKEVLEADLGFEYMLAPENDLWVFAGRCLADRVADHSGEFIRQHAWDLIEATCCFPVEFLTVTTESRIGDIRLLPLDHPDVAEARPVLTGAAAAIGCVAAVTVRGTSAERMAARGRPVVRRALQALRVAMRESPGYRVEQLRFRLAPGYVFTKREAMAWSVPPDVAWDNTLPEDLSEILSRPVARLAISAEKKVEKKALVALDWMERAYLTGDRLVKMLYLFFAMESLLGDTAEGLKSHPLAYRQMMLSHIVMGGFRNPNVTLTMYVKIRNAAVHGEELPEVDEQTVGQFEWAVRDVLNQYLELAQREEFRSRSQLTKFLDTHPDRPKMLDWLRQNGAPEWAIYTGDDESAPVGSGPVPDDGTPAQGAGANDQEQAVVPVAAVEPKPKER